MFSEVKSKVLAFARGGEPALVTKFFNDMDLNHSGSLTMDEVTRMMEKLEISVERKFIHPYFKIIDADNSGCVEEAEWNTYILGGK